MSADIVLKCSLFHHRVSCSEASWEKFLCSLSSGGIKLLWSIWPVDGLVLDVVIDVWIGFLFCPGYWSSNWNVNPIHKSTLSSFWKVKLKDKLIFGVTSLKKNYKRYLKCLCKIQTAKKYAKILTFLNQYKLIFSFHFATDF